ncbi:hypothetical protein SAMN04487967_3623 [Natronorubrum sediminis]|uniref:Uncharacterized protein n=1 Tax=Natronorubrum sediminis TaxID=640943 RepID=A0A1H6G4T1_9EURY|nr:hypothetical protein [Natronorubrum sediminis]SEH18097.1 hypothetical protein SAMN04487967_3623 [Natronorubrum sediminis]
MTARIHAVNDDETHITFFEDPTPGEDSVELEAVSSEEDLDEYGELAIRVGDSDEEELTEDPVSVGHVQGEYPLATFSEAQR